MRLNGVLLYCDICHDGFDLKNLGTGAIVFDSRLTNGNVLIALVKGVTSSNEIPSKRCELDEIMAKKIKAEN